MATQDTRWLDSQIGPKKAPLRGKDRPKITSPDAAQLNGIYKRIEKYLHPSLREYAAKRYSGEATLDAVKDAELLITLLTVYTAQMVEKGIEDGVVTQDVARLVGETRLSLKDYEDMVRRREDTERKHGDDGRVVDPLRESALGRFTSIGGPDTARPA